MSDREPDFEFDFFEEPETREAAGASARSAAHCGGPRAPRRRAARSARRAGFTPLLRLSA